MNNDVEGLLICRLCKKKKSATEFWWRIKAERIRQSECIDCRRVINRQAKIHGLTSGEYEVMLHNQEGVCYLCRQPETVEIMGRVIKLAVDHDHGCCSGTYSCGKCVRSLLCHRCNTKVAWAEYLRPLLPKLKPYLKERAIKRYGTWFSSDEMAKAQGNKCFLCKIPSSKLEMDHDHGCLDHVGSKRGCWRCVRAMLCCNCNNALGFYEMHLMHNLTLYFEYVDRWRQIHDERARMRV